MTSVIDRRREEVSAFLKSHEYRTKWSVEDALLDGAQKSLRYLDLVVRDGSVKPPLDVTKGASLFRGLFVYGYFGFWDLVTRPTDMPHRLKEAFSIADDIIASGHPDAIRLPARIADLARGRWALDNALGGISPAALATLAGVTERHIQNLMSKDTAFRANGLGMIDVSKVEKWLASRPSFRPSVWELIEETQSVKKAILVPQASDGTIFSPSLRRRSGYTIGPKGDERRYDEFDEALRALQEMNPPRWRRPNEKSAWGVVTGTSWVEVPEQELSIIRHDHFSKD